jgi:hypothetical protein
VVCDGVTAVDDLLPNRAGIASVASKHSGARGVDHSPSPVPKDQNSPVDTHKLYQLADLSCRTVGRGFVGVASAVLEGKMGTFWDQVVALVEQGDPQRARRRGGGDRRAGDLQQVGERSAALREHFEEIERALGQLERMRGLFQGFLSPVSELAFEFDACAARLDDATAKLAAALEERDCLAERCARLEREIAHLRASSSHAAAG